MDDWSERAQQQQQQHSPGLMERGGQQQEEEESSYEHGLMLVDSGSDPRAWLALVQPPDACVAHAAASDYLQHSPDSSTSSSYQGKSTFPITHKHLRTNPRQVRNRCNRWLLLRVCKR